MDFEKLAAFRLSYFSHTRPEDGLCAMEAVAWLEGLPHSDRPACTCPVISDFVQGLNDGFSDDDRQKLIPYLPKLVGTNDPTLAKARGEWIDSAVRGACAVPWGRLRGAYYCLGNEAAQSLPASEALAILDAALAIGAPSPGFSTDVEARVDEYRALIDAA